MILTGISGIYAVLAVDVSVSYLVCRFALLSLILFYLEILPVFNAVTIQCKCIQQKCTHACMHIAHTHTIRSEYNIKLYFIMLETFLRDRERVKCSLFLFQV